MNTKQLATVARLNAQGVPLHVAVALVLREVNTK